MYVLEVLKLKLFVKPSRNSTTVTPSIHANRKDNTLAGFTVFSIISRFEFYRTTGLVVCDFNLTSVVHCKEQDGITLMVKYVEPVPMLEMMIPKV